LLFGEHAVIYGYPCIVTAVDQRLFVTVTLNGENVFHMSAPDLGLTAYSKTIDDLGGKGLPTGVRFIEVLYKRFLDMYPQNRGIDVVTRSEFSATFGFGSSSASTVAFAKALFAAYGIAITNKALFDICYQTVLDVQGVGSGFDVAAAIWGGTLYYVAPGKVVEQLSMTGLPMVVGYTGIKADTPTLVRQVAELKRKHTTRFEELFNQIGTLVVEAKTALEQADWQRVGELMNKNQMILAELGVSSAELEKLNAAAHNAGALGSKLSGAGGGDCMIAVVDERQGLGVGKAIDAVGEWMRVTLGAEGVRIEP
jgi:mevalonate kinase